jgi:hypothetical protein
MFIAVQFPFADVRPFLPEDTNRLPSPTWPLPEPNREFLRSFGIVKPRRRGGIKDWPGEELYCRATRALRFMSGFARLDKDGGATLFRERYCAFRRLMADGRAVVRLELGIGYRRHKTTAGPMDSPACLAFIRSIFNLPVRMIDAQGSVVGGCLLGIERHLAQKYLQATTGYDNGQLQRTEKWWLKAGTPLTLIEYVIDRDIEELPRASKRVTTLRDSSVDLSHCRVELHGRRLGVWFLGIRPGETNLDFLRRLRINLLRLHAEKEGLKQMLRLIAQRRIIVESGTAASDPNHPSQHLQDYLHNAIRFLSKESFYGLPQSDILEAAHDFEEFVSEGERETLLSQLAPIRRNLLRNVEAFVAPQRAGSGFIVNITGVQYFINREHSGNITMTNQSLNIGGEGSVFHGDVNVNQVAARTIQGSFNRVANADVDAELKRELEALATAVGEMLKHMPDETEQKQAAQDLETLTNEVLSESPRRQWYELSAEGLIKAAKTVGEIAEPVVKAAAAVLALLA